VLTKPDEAAPEAVPEAEAEEMVYELPPLALDEAQARQFWLEHAPRLPDPRLYELPSEAELTRALARQVLAEGNFECYAIQTWDECGEYIAEWDVMPEDVGFDDPCLRRVLALWALEEGQLTPGDVHELLYELTTLFELPAPEDELPMALLDLAQTLPEPLAMELYEAAVGTEWAAQLGSILDGLSEQNQARLAKLGVEAAFAYLAPEQHRALFVENLNSSSLSLSCRHALLTAVEALAGDDVDEALRVMSGDEDCQLAMYAAKVLASRGIADELPRYSASLSPESLSYELCRLGWEDDPSTREALAEAFFSEGPIVELEPEDPYVEYFDESEEGAVQEPSEPMQWMRDELDLSAVVDAFSAGSISCWDNGEDEKLCTISTSSEQSSVRWKREASGAWVIVEFMLHEYFGCPC
jgi:hypothetical protein